MFALFTRESAVTIAAEFMKRRFRRLGQIRACAAVAVVAAAEAGLIDEIVMAGDAIDGSMILMREKCMQRRGRRCGLQQAQTADGGRQEQQRDVSAIPDGISVENNRSGSASIRGRHAVQNSASASRTQQVTLLMGRSSSWPLPTMWAPSRPSSSAASTVCVATLAEACRGAGGMPQRPTATAMPVATSTASATSAARPQSMYSGADGNR